MSRLWKLVLLCGLLTGTSRSVAEGLGNNTSDVQNLKPVLDKGPDTTDHALQNLLGNLEDDLNILQQSKVWQLAKQKIQKAQKTVLDVLSKILSLKDKALGVNISMAHIVDFKSELTPDGEGLNLRFPVTADVAVILPLIGQTVNLKASLDLLTGVTIVTDAVTDQPKVVLTDCTSDPASVSLSLLGNHSTLVNKLVDTVTSFLGKTVSLLVQNQLCPVIHLFISSMDVHFFQNIIDNLQKGIKPEIPS